MSGPILPLIAGIASSTAFGAVCGLAYHHVIVPFNEAFRSHGRPSFTGRRPALAVGHSCTSEHPPEDCPCPPRRRRTVVMYQGVDWRRSWHAVTGRYPLGTEIPVHVSYRTNRPHPLTWTTAVHGALRGAAG
ncbi:hypothetical protein [Nocardia crassostreae]|uniref:hypothetical protein n=1 Tax=Nocardia crassostreae TaxID=53428 RepID=UPI00082E2F09|nr:hypothetical protein [Nocardia crassostreae]